jgi:hypothetical protein
MARGGVIGKAGREKGRGLGGFEKNKTSWVFKGSLGVV